MLSQALSKIIVIYLLCSYQKKLPEVGVQNGRHCHGGPQYLIYVITENGYRKYVFKRPPLFYGRPLKIIYFYLLNSLPTSIVCISTFMITFVLFINK